MEDVAMYIAFDIVFGTRLTRGVRGEAERVSVFIDGVLLGVWA